MKYIWVAFQHENASIIGKAIQLYTANSKDRFNSKWREVAYHVEISFNTIHWFGSRAEDKGVGNRKTNVYGWRKYKIEVTDDEYVYMQELALLKIGKGYDWLNILGSDLFELNLHIQDKYTCDEFVALMLMQCKFGRNLNCINRLSPKRLEDYVKRTLNE